MSSSCGVRDLTLVRMMGGLVYLNAYSGGREAEANLDTYLPLYDTQRPYQSLRNRTAREVFNGDSVGETAQKGKRSGFQT